MIEYRKQPIRKPIKPVKHFNHYTKRRNKNPFFYISLLVISGILVAGGIFLVKKIQKHIIQKREIAIITNYVSDCDHVRFSTAPIKPSNKLNDPNEVQLIHAQTNGINPVESDSIFNIQIDSLISRSILAKVTENRFYQVKTLSFSQPYLIPEGVDMLNEIGYRFQERLKEKKYNNFKFRITSILRTVGSQSKLCHRNGNATDHSAHIYGTTLDISYKNFYNTNKDTIESKMEPILAITKVLTDMRKECKLLVVRERHQSCFHITVVVCRPPVNKNN
jgi:hypothetical protein